MKGKGHYSVSWFPGNNYPMQIGLMSITQQANSHTLVASNGLLI